MKKVLVISFSQSGQLTQIVKNFLIPFKETDIDWVQIRPKDPFPFPWGDEEFYNVFPETVLEEPIQLHPPQFKYNEYDLIVLGYQPWYLSPSMPTTAIFENEKFCKLINNKPIVTIIGSRNMWLNAQESIKILIKNAGGKLVANIPLADKTTNLVSAITIIHWMSTGKKERKWGVFPLPGVSDKDINETNIFGEIVIKSLESGCYDNLQNNIVALNKIRINTSIMFIESRAKTLFRIWANIIKKKGVTPSKRKRWLKIFKRYLFFALFFVSPIVLTIFNLILRPLTFVRIKRKKEYFRSVKLN